jgi:hypothetical protein
VKIEKQETNDLVKFFEKGEKKCEIEILKNEDLNFATEDGGSGLCTGGRLRA